VGLQIAMAAVGLAILPALCGLSAQRFGLESVPLLLGACWIALLIIYSLLERPRRQAV
jgi:fucose permease